MSAIEKAFDLGFSVETDILDVEGVVYIAHEALNLKSAPLFSDVSLRGSIAINLKSDGAWKFLTAYRKQIFDSKSFFFDGSGPVMHQISESLFPSANRVSEFEQENKFQADYLWVDSFLGRPWWTQFDLEKWTQIYNKLIFVSSELHRLKYESIWIAVRDAIRIYGKEKIAICTDHAIEFHEFCERGENL